ncbi:relaxase/mobilization nuclease domain-containing protein [Tenacibaculum mesophilum]|uniref:relaxase/mobilization nuclease domain-containing protein n=1 Tax=Tenacibaculum mesophilum TaxID=104268 RepID=UPI00069D9710|nr:relaxase/mobilization nuclease domain-containing protein [Tenacibaculum mesophilum]
MIGKGKAISHTKASIEYGWNQEKDAEIVYKQNLAGETPKEITKEFKIIQSMNDKCERNTFSFVISPTIEDGKKLDLKDLNKITSEFVKDLKLENHQAIAFVHNDKNHKHIHLYVNRIDFNGTAYKDNFIGKRSQKTAEKVAEKLELQTVKQIKEQKLENLKEVRKYIKEKHELSFKFFHPENYQQYINQLRQFNIQVKPVINKSNQLQGFRYKLNNINLKGSEVHRSLSINKLKSKFLEIAKATLKQISITK